MDRRDSLKKMFGADKSILAQAQPDAVTQAAQDSPRKTVHKVLTVSAYCTRPAEFSKPLENGVVQCQLCPNDCIIHPGKRGQCLTRANKNGTLYTTVYGFTRAHAVPLRNPQFPLIYHTLDGTIATVGLVGCGLRCSFCFAWQAAQADPDDMSIRPVAPEQVVKQAVAGGCRAVVFTTNEPSNNFEFTRDLAVMARKEGLPVAVSTSGFCNPEAFDALTDHCDALVFGIKGFTEENYRKHTGGRLQPVLDNLAMAAKKGIPVEIQYLVMPSITDSAEEISAMAKYVEDVLGPYTPVFLNRFYPAHKMRHVPPTPLDTMNKARRICSEAGLKYVNVYFSNVFMNDFLRDNPHWDHSVACPYCGNPLVRYDFSGKGPEFVSNVVRGHCRFCGNQVPGLAGIIPTA